MTPVCGSHRYYRNFKGAKTTAYVLECSTDSAIDGLPQHTLRVTPQPDWLPVLALLHVKRTHCYRPVETQTAMPSNM
jgi:hypothetical protein